MKSKVFALIVALIFAAGGFGLAAYIFNAPARTGATIEDSSIRTIHLDDGIRAGGLRAERVLVPKGGNKATLYVSFLREFSGHVLLQAYDRTGSEIGRSRRLVAGKTDEADYVEFEFARNVPLDLAESFRLVPATLVMLPAVNVDAEPGTEVRTESETIPEPAENPATSGAEQPVV